MSRSKLFEQEQKLKTGRSSSAGEKSALGGNRDVLGAVSARTDISAPAAAESHSAFDAASGAILTPMSMGAPMAAGAPVQAKKGRRKGKTVDIDKFMYEDDLFMTPDDELDDITDDSIDDDVDNEYDSFADGWDDFSRWQAPALDDDALATAHVAEMIAPRKRSRNPFKRFRRG